MINNFWNYAEATGIISLVAMILLLVVFLFYALPAIGRYMIFKKAGKNGWCAFVPIYGEYVLCTIVGVNPYWLLIRYCSVIIPVIGQVISIVGGIYYRVLISFSLARAFKKDDGFAFGLLFLDCIFSVILGFGKDDYIGPRPMKDAIFKNNYYSNGSDNMNQSNNNYNNNQNNSNSSSVKYCPECGSVIENGANFCNNCGRKL